MRVKAILTTIGLALLLVTTSTVHAGKIVGLGGMCMDIKGGAAKGNPVIIWPCNGQLNQTWYPDNDDRAIRSGDGYCLDVQGGGGKGSKVIAWNCHGKKNQQWFFKKDGTIRTRDGLCLDVRGGKAVKGSELIVWPCKKNDNANQRWNYRK